MVDLPDHCLCKYRTDYLRLFGYIKSTNIFYNSILIIKKDTCPLNRCLDRIATIISIKLIYNIMDGSPLNYMFAISFFCAP